MFILKFFLIASFVFLAIGLFIIVAVAGFVRDMLFGGSKTRRQGDAAQGRQRSAQSSSATGGSGGASVQDGGSKQNGKKRKIFSADEGEYVDYTEV